NSLQSTRQGPDGMTSGPRIARLSVHRQPGGGATSSRLFCRASGPSWVTETAAVTSRIAEQTNKAVSPKPDCTHRKLGLMKAVASRPTAAGQPKPDARALVGKTSEVKICIALPAT